MTFERRLASGAEGEVWLGRKAGHDGNVVIKVAHFADDTNTQPVWREAEVVRTSMLQSTGMSWCVWVGFQAFMINATHPRLVEMLGCGYMADMKDPDSTVLFQVLEYMDGGKHAECQSAKHLKSCIIGSLDFIWALPREQISWEQRLRWATDVAEVSA